MHLRLSLALLATLGASRASPAQDPAEAQAPQREPCRVALRRADGSSWAGATLHFVSRVVGPHHELPFADIVQAKSDERGRAQAQLLPGRGYSVWAHGDPDHERRYLVSHVEEGVRAGDVVRVRAKAEPQRQFELEIDGLDAWRERGEVTATLLSTELAHRWQVELPLDDERILLPPGPGPSLFVQLRSSIPSAGAFWQEPVPVSPWSLKRALEHGSKLPIPTKGDETKGEYTIHVPPPRGFEVKVTDLQDQGIAGATVYRDVTQARAPWQQLAKTDAKGIATLTLPGYSKDGEEAFAHDLCLLARAAGHADNVLLRGSFGSGDAQSIQLADGFAPELRLRWSEEEALPRQVVLLYTSVQRGKSGGQVGASPYRFVTDDRGAATLTGRPKNYAALLALVPSPKLLARLPQREGFPTAPLIPLGSWMEKSKTPPRYLLSEFVPMDIELTRVDGRPERDAWLHIGSLRYGGNEPHYSLRLRCTRAGRLRVWMQPGTRWALATTGPEVLHAKGVTVPEIRREKSFPIELPETLLLSGIVRDGNGEPVPFAPIMPLSIRLRVQRDDSVTLSNWNTLFGLSRSSQRGARKSPATKGFANMPFRAAMWAWHSAGIVPLRSDVRGRFRLALPQQSNLELRATTPLGRDYVESELLRVSPGDELDGRTLRFPTRN